MTLLTVYILCFVYISLAVAAGFRATSILSCRQKNIDFLYFHYNPRLQCSNNMCASVFQHIFTALALQLHCSSDKDNKYMLDIFSLQFVRLQLEMKSNIQSFSPFAYNLSSQTFTYQYIHPSWFFERTFTHHRPQLNKRHLPIGTFTHHRPQLKKGLLPVTGFS